MKYLFDSNVFIEAKNRYYAFDICPGFWDWMDHVVETDAGTIIPVRDELLAGRDELAEWIRARRDHKWFSAVDDADCQKAFAAVADHVQRADYREPAKALFLSKADPWLVARASVAGCILVTHEVPSPDAKARVPLPNICDAFGVRYMNTFDALRGLAASFTFVR